MNVFTKDSTFICVVFFWFLATHLCGVYLFSTGFFPQKESFTGFSSPNDFNQTEGPEGIKVSAKYDRLVLMVIDAFRSDFIFGQETEMKYVRSMLEAGEARGFVSQAHAPTVTLPRIKALISGSIPSYSDFIMNFNSKEIKDDNIISQFRRAGKNTSFYGDDTWLKLFPNEFNRFEGVSSFYVTDYTEVDNNVTRHIEPELKERDWSLLVLHYLGLDHIGHMEGPLSDKMGPKIRQMDEIVESIYSTIKKQDIETGSRSLLVICSDHGMNEVGNHGGTSEGETSAVMIFMSKEFKPTLNVEFKTVAQVDLTPTLALLFGLPIPKNNMGSLIPDLFVDFPDEEYLRALELNSLQRLQLMKANKLFWANDAPTRKSEKLMNLFEEARQMHASWGAIPLKHSHFESQAADLYLQFMNNLYIESSESLTTYDDYSLILGIILISISAFGFLSFVWAYVRQFVARVRQIFLSRLFYLFTIVVGLMFTIIHFKLFCSLFSSSQLCMSNNLWIIYSACTLVSISIPLVLFTLLLGYRERGVFIKSGNNSLMSRFIIFGTLLHLVSMFASSLVEEEHQTWYFLVSTALLLSFIGSYFEQTGSWEIIVTLVCFRLLRFWNQTGIKWMDDLANIENETNIDFGRWLNSPHLFNKLIRFCICGIACIVPCIYAGRFADSEKMLIGKVTSAVFRNSIIFCAISIFVYKLTLFPFPSIWMARFVYLCLGVTMFVAIGYPFWKGQKRVPDKTIQHQQTLDDLIMTYAKVTPSLLLFAYTMLLLLLSKVHNMFVFVLLGVAAHYLPSYTKRNTNYYSRAFEVMAITHWMGQTAYFGFGNSNSLSTIDISGAYTGISSYSETAVGTLVAIILYSGPAFFYMAGIVTVTRMYYNEHTVKGTHSYARMFESYLFICFCVAMIRSLQICIFSIVTMIMKHHLFVWSVFSPKYIYELMADGYMLFCILFCFVLFIHNCLIGLMLDRRRKNKQNKET